MKHKNIKNISPDEKLHKAYATKIKKLVETAKELQTENIRIALPITRLTSIKSLCQDELAAGNFALYLSKIIQQQALQATRFESITPEEWEIHQTLIKDAIALMESYLENPMNERKQPFWSFLRQISDLQGDNFRRIHGTTIHFVKSGYLLKLEYAIRCFTDRDFPHYAYRLAREYTELYKPQYGTGLIPESANMLLEIAEFWCQYFFGQNLTEKFPKLMTIDRDSK